MVKKLIPALLVLFLFGACTSTQKREVAEQEYTTEIEEVYLPGKIMCTEAAFIPGSQNVVKLTYQQFYDKVRLERRNTFYVTYEETDFDEYVLIFHRSSGQTRQETSRELIKTEIINRKVLEQNIQEKTATLELQAGETITVFVTDIRESVERVSANTTITSQTPVSRKAFSGVIQEDGRYEFDETMYETMLKTAWEKKAPGEFNLSIYWDRVEKNSEDYPFWELNVAEIPQIATALADMEKIMQAGKAALITEKDSVETYRKNQRQLASLFSGGRYRFQQNALMDLIVKNYTLMQNNIDQKRYDQFIKAPFFLIQGDIKEYDRDLGMLRLWGLAIPAIQNAETFLLKGAQPNNCNIIIMLGTEKPQTPTMYFTEKAYFVNTLSGKNAYGAAIPVYSYSLIPPTNQKAAAAEYERLGALYESLKTEHEQMKRDLES